MDIEGWLRGLGLERYADAFRTNDIGLDVVADLSDADLRDLGVSLGDRKRLLKAARPLRTEDAGRVPLGAAAATPERRQLTVVFVDLVGSTALGAGLDPEEMRDVLRAYHDAVAGEVRRYEGSVGKLLGDGVLAYFGWPTAHEDEAERAVRAALAAVGATGRLRTPKGEPLAARAGIATGLAVVGELIGEGAAREEMVVGTVANLAARLQALAAPGQVVLADGTRRLLGGVFELEDLGRHAVKGIAEPVAAFAVQSERPAISRFEVRAEAGLRPMLGRDEELALLLRQWRLAQAGEGQAVIVVGEPGIGKSRLVRALKDSIAAEPHVALPYQCSPFHAASPLWPVTQQLAAAAGFAPGQDRAARSGRVAAVLGEAVDAPDEPLALLAPLLGLAPDRDPSAGLDARERRAQTLAALVGQLLGLAARKAPVLAVFEDVHWIDPTSLELVRLVLDAIAPARVLIVLTSRSEGEPALGGASHLARLCLGRLGRAASEHLVGGIAAAHALDDGLRREILARTDGVPLFVEELTKAVLEDGPGDPGSILVPPTLEDSLLARLGRSPAMRTVAQVAACIGRDFDRAILAAAADLPRDVLDAGLDELVRRELVSCRGAQPGFEYSFKHALVRDAAYQSLLRQRRREVHARIAEALEAERPEVAAAQPELVAHHYAEAGLPGRAATARLAAGRLAKARHATREASAHVKAALGLARDAEAAAPGSMRALMRECAVLLGDLASYADDLGAANAAYEEALALALADTEAERAAIGNMRHRLAFATTADGARMAYYEHGGGAPAVVLVSPNVYGLAVFQPILERLRQEFRVVTVDRRGAGRSDPLVRPYGLRHQAGDLRAVLEHAAAGPFVGVGISRGSNLLLRLAHDRPGLFAGLVLVGMPLASAGDGTPRRRLRAACGP
jgi:class 3 adenylate cyclase